MKTVTIVGARPQFIKHFPVAQALRDRGANALESVIVHTGQHYDYAMSKVFFDEMGIPAPDYNLGVGSGLHGAQTGKMLIALEEVLLQERPDVVLIYGDTNSTLAGALAASKLHIPLAHVEAGLRSFNRRMPEEINRMVADSLSDTLFCPTQTAVDNLNREGIHDGVFLVGDVMLDAIMHFVRMAEQRSAILERIKVRSREYSLLTVHRDHNTDNPENLAQILLGLERSGEGTIVFPCHPRCRKAMAQAALKAPGNVLMIEPVGYLDMVKLEAHARRILTDSGGVQKEAYFLKVPCITLREETEWVETVQAGWNVLTGADAQRIARAIDQFHPSGVAPEYFGQGNAAVRIVEQLMS